MGIQGNTGEYRGIQWNKWEYRKIQGNTGEYRGIQDIKGIEMCIKGERDSQYAKVNLA